MLDIGKVLISFAIAIQALSPLSANALENKVQEGKQAAQATIDHFHVCTVASYRRANLHKLITSCKKHDIALEVIGLYMPYFGNGTKLLRLRDYLNTLPDDDVVMFVDAFDVLIIKDKGTILKKFLSMDAPFVMSAEKNCFPFPECAKLYPDSPFPFKFINSGCFIGYVATMKQWLKELEPFQLDASDQGQITLHYLYKNRSFVIDDACELFLSLYQVTDDEVVIDENERTVHCLPTGTEPAVIHANGSSFGIWNRVYDSLVVK